LSSHARSIMDCTTVNRPCSMAIRAAVDECLCVPSDLTPRIQEGHTLIGHMLCEYAERALFGNEK